MNEDKFYSLEVAQLVLHTFKFRLEVVLAVALTDVLEKRGFSRQKVRSNMNGFGMPHLTVLHTVGLLLQIS